MYDCHLGGSYCFRESSYLWISVMVVYFMLSIIDNTKSVERTLAFSSIASGGNP